MLSVSTGNLQAVCSDGCPCKDSVSLVSSPNVYLSILLTRALYRSLSVGVVFDRVLSCNNLLIFALPLSIAGVAAVITDSLTRTLLAFFGRSKERNMIAVVNKTTTTDTITTVGNTKPAFAACCCF